MYQSRPCLQWGKIQLLNCNLNSGRCFVPAAGRCPALRTKSSCRTATNLPTVPRYNGAHPLKVRWILTSVCSSVESMSDRKYHRSAHTTFHHYVLSWRNMQQHSEIPKHFHKRCMKSSHFGCCSLDKLRRRSSSLKTPHICSQCPLTQYTGASPNGRSFIINK